MLRSICTLLVVVLAGLASPAGAAAAVAAPAAADAKAKPKAKRPAKEAPPSPQKSEYSLARANLVYAARSCTDKPDRCDQELLHESESRFLKACNACTGLEECRDELKAIGAGKGTKGFAPCK